MRYYETIWVLLILGAKQLGSVYSRLEVPLPMGCAPGVFFYPALKMACKPQRGRGGGGAG